MVSRHALITMNWIRRSDGCRERVTFILPAPDQPATVDEILKLAKVLVFRRGIKGLINDPWNELDHSRAPNLTETEYVSQCLSRIRAFARAHGVHVFVVAHPTKLIKDKSGNYPVPTPYDISGSAHWRNKADKWRDLADEHSRVVEIHVQKVRFKDVGRVGKAERIYYKPSGRYYDTRGGLWIVITPHWRTEWTSKTCGKYFEERAGILEHTVGLQQHKAEREAAGMSVEYARRKGYSWEALRAALACYPALLAEMPENRFLPLLMDTGAI